MPHEKMKKPFMKPIWRNTFYQLLAIYIVLVLLVSFRLVWKYTLHFELYAVILALIGSVALYQRDEKAQMNKVLHYFLLVLGLVIVFSLRAVPYMDNSIPLGYDAGIYKYGFENFAAEGFGMDSWVRGAMSPGILYLTFLFYTFGMSSQFLLTTMFILFGVLLGFAVYVAGKEYFGTRAGVIALLLYSVSVIQYKVFTYLYYKNVIALSCLLFALYFLRRSEFAVSAIFKSPRNFTFGEKPTLSSRDLASNPLTLAEAKSLAHPNHPHGNNRKSPPGLHWNRILFIVFGILTGVFHLPTFFVFGLAFVSYTVHRYQTFGRNCVNGIIILGVTLLLYVGFWDEAIAPLLFPVAQSFVEPGTASGTFVSFFVYQFSTLYYLPFAILGFLYVLWKREFSMVFFMTLITAIIVYFQFFFFNRFIIHLDIFLIVLAGAGFSLLIDNGKKIGITILCVMLVIAGFVTLQDARTVTPLISAETLHAIEEIEDITEKDARVIAISSEYAPWVLAYSGRETIAPGLFEANTWTQSEWEAFWSGTDQIETISLLSHYEKPIYLFAGTKSFNNTCFSEVLNTKGNRLLRYEC